MKNKEDRPYHYDEDEIEERSQGNISDYAS